MQKKLRVTSPLNATQLPCEQNLSKPMFYVLKQLVLKIINDNTEEHENCNPQTLNLLPL